MKKQAKQAPSKQKTKPAVSYISKEALLYAFVCAVFALLLYSNTIGHEYVLDDEAVITKNEFVQQGIAGIPSILSVDMWHFQNSSFGYYRPLSLITFAIEYQISPGSPHLSHFINVLLYALSCFILCLILMKIFKSYNPIYAIIVCLLFAAHPLHTEVVANIKSRDEILALLNMLLSVFFVMKAAETGKITPRSFILPCLFFYLALLSKETAQMELFLIPLILIFISAASMRTMAVAVAPLIVVLVLFQLQKYALLGTLLGSRDPDIVSFPYAGSGLELPTAFYIFAYAMKLILLPYPLTYSYGFNQMPAVPYTNAVALIGLIIFVVAGILAYRYFRLKSPIGLGIAIWLIMILPGMAFTLLKGGIFAERLLFVPVLGFSIIVAWALIKLSAILIDTRESPRDLIRNWKLAVPVTAILLVYSVMTIARNTTWRDNTTLFAHDVEVSPHSCQAHFHYGVRLIDSGIASTNPVEKKDCFRHGIKELDEAIRINPKYGDAYFDKGYAYHSLQYNFDSALYYYKIAIRETPGIAQIYNNLGMLYANVGKHNIASYYFNKAVEVNPYYTEAAKNHERHVRETGLDVKTLPEEAASH